MNVLLVTNTREGGGTEQHVASIAKALNLDVAYLDEDGLLGIRRKARRADVVHFFLWRSYVLGSLVCRGKVRIMSRRSLRGCYQTPLIRFIEKLLHKRTRVLVGNSPAVVEELWQEVFDADIRLIRSGTTIRPFGHIPSPVFRMLCVGNEWPYKGHADLTEALRLVGPALPEPWHMTFAGGGTETINGWRVTGLGYRTDIAQLLADADLFILPSHEEGSSNALLEAMACGVPVIATAVGGNVDMVEHNVTGLLVPPRSPRQLGDAIVAMTSLALRRRLAGAAAIDVAKRFSFKQSVDNYAALYWSVNGQGV